MTKIKQTQIYFIGTNTVSFQKMCVTGIFGCLLITYLICSSMAAFYVNICMAMTAYSTIATIVVLNIHFRSAKVALSPVIRIFFIGNYCRETCI